MTGEERRQYTRYQVAPSDNVEIWLRPDSDKWPLILKNVVDISESGVAVSTKDCDSKNAPQPSEEVPMEVVIAGTRLYFVGKVIYNREDTCRMGLEFAPLSRRNIELFYDFLDKKAR